jgi:hypothetical protein
VSKPVYLAFLGIAAVINGQTVGFVVGFVVRLWEGIGRPDHR